MLIRWKQLNNSLGYKKDQKLSKIRGKLYRQVAVMGAIVLITLVLVFAMTAAWYTNVVSTSGLHFQAESWGFDGGVVVEEDPIKAAPGDEGVIAMQISNDGDLASAISVNISKEFMGDDQICQRIFFYADKTAQINDETVDRIYLSNSGSYTYRLEAKNTLILSDQVYTDVQLKWEWVYDVVGYYFRGTYDGAAFTVEEYLRPVVYSYDDAQYDETTGQLLKVNPQTDVFTFLCDTTKTDGFSGNYDVELAQAGGQPALLQNGQPVQTTLNCYPIDAENNIWLYLCTKQEIEQNTAWDTAYGINQDAQLRSFQARVIVTGEQLQQQIQQVDNVVSLSAALNENSGEIITLNQDLVLTETLAIEQGVQAVLDLNGHQIITEGATAFAVASGAQLTLMDGSIAGDKTKTVAFQSVGGQITMSNVQITDVYNALVIADHTTTNDQGDNSVVRIANCDIIADDVAVMISGDGTASARKTALMVQNSTIESGYIAIMGNGTATKPGRWGTDIQVVSSIVNGLYAGVYQPQKQSNLTVKDSTVSGWTGIAVKGGSVTILDSTVMGNGQDGEVQIPTENMLLGSGFVDTGDGIYAETDYGYLIDITVSGASTIGCTASNACAVRVFPETKIVDISLTSGTYQTDVSAYLKEGYICSRTDDGYVVTAANG